MDYGKYYRDKIANYYPNGIMDDIILEMLTDIEQLESELTELKNKHAAEANANTVLGDVPNDDEIKQVATDESQKDDWMELPYRQIYAEGFVDGAIWCKKKITRHIT